MTDESVIEWASGWLRENTLEDPTFRQRFLDGLATELRSRSEALQAICDLAAARLANLDAVRSEVDFENLEHDLKEIVRITGKTWR